MYLNSKPGTRFFFDTNLAEFVSSVGGASTQVFPCFDTLEGIKKKELVSIADLNTYISNSNEQAQKAGFLCTASIVGFLQQNGWSFVSCTGCNKKLERCGTSLNCSICETADVTGFPLTMSLLKLRLCVQLAVDDGKDNMTFVVYDKEMTKLTKQEAFGSNSGEEELPSFLKELIGKEFVFQIRVIPFKFTPNHRIFTVSTITEDTILQKHGKEHSGNNPSSEVDVGLAASPSGPSVVGDKIGEKCGTTDLPEMSGTQNNRKRRRE
ncbi:hypothetical protein N665_0015s0062 [Sinapis alba]|nr:hypothetical protein N665_0015s0062 [Sinapis alba]